MTMPHLMNCPHCEDWCLDCVKTMHDALTAAAKRVDELEGAIGYLSRLFKAHAPQCEPMDYPGGIVSQIDNCMAGMRDEIASLTSQLAALKAVAGELVQAMVDYEMDVDNSPPRKHRDMMQRAREALATTTNGEGER